MPQCGFRSNHLPVGEKNQSYSLGWKDTREWVPDRLRGWNENGRRWSGVDAGAHIQEGNTDEPRGRLWSLIIGFARQENSNHKQTLAWKGPHSCGLEDPREQQQKAKWGRMWVWFIRSSESHKAFWTQLRECVCQCVFQEFTASKYNQIPDYRNFRMLPTDPETVLKQVADKTPWDKWGCGSVLFTQEPTPV